jgi:tRNA 2-selenouridine synthase
MNRVNSKDYRQIFLTDAPMIDLRAPCEFEQGAFPHAINLPLMSDDERMQVGICYKKNGQDSAIALGHQLVCGEVKQTRINAWKQFAQSHLDKGFIYCFRGGLRSRTSQRWLLDAGIELPLIEGGYKAMRSFLITETERLVDCSHIHIIAGLTGTGKTDFILKQVNAIDLEALANHRGSSFGKRISPQPSQINFENSLAIQLMKHENDNKAFLLLEDEGRLIGARSLPLVLKNKMDQSPLIMIEESFEFRVEQIFKDYVTKMMTEFDSAFEENAINKYREFLIHSTKKITKRLGGVGLSEMLVLIERAIDAQQNTDNLSKHQDWIVYLLKKYYDPMYGYQMSKKQQRPKFSGTTAEVKSYIDSL